MKLSSKQAKYYKQSNAKINIAEGSVRSGKTFITNLRWLKYVEREAPKGKLLISGVTSETLKENVLDDIEMMVGKVNFQEPKKGGIGYLYGRQFEARGAENIASEKRIRGRTYAGWYADEITLHHKSFIRQAITRNSAKGAKMFWTTNPDHPKHIVRTEYMLNEKMKRENQVFTEKFLLEDNLTLSTEYKELLKNSFSGVFYERNIKGEWVIAEGLVYKDFRETVHVIPREEVNMMIKHKVFKYYIAGIDWGHSHPMTCNVYGVTHDNKYIQIDEFYQVQQLTEDLGRWIVRIQKEVLGEPIRFAFADTAEPDRIVTLASYPYNINIAKTRKDKDAGINSVMTTFKTNRLLISDKCENTIDELLVYRYPDEDDVKFAKDEPLKEDDHSMDSKRYAVHNHELILLGEELKSKRRRPGARARSKRK